MTTIKDIAEYVHVAPSTVSNVLNDSKYVSDELRQKVCKAVEELGYKPNLVARSLKTKRTDMVGVITSELSSFFVEILGAIEEFFHQNGYSVVVCCSGGDEEKEKEYLENLAQRGIDGLLFLGGGYAPVGLLRKYSVPVMLLDCDAARQGVPCVVFDNERGGYLATRHLLQQGARRIAIVNGLPHVSTQADREKGYRRALAEFGIEPDPSLVEHCAWLDYKSGCEAVEQFRQRGVLFDAVFAANDFVAVGVQKSLQKHGMRVPEDIRVVGFGDFSVSEMVTPALTTVRQPRRQMGHLAAKALYECLRAPALPEEGTSALRLAPELVVRESS